MVVFVHFIWLCAQKVVPLQRFSKKALRRQASPQQRARSLRSACTVIAPFLKFQYYTFLIIWL